MLKIHLLHSAFYVKSSTSSDVSSFRQILSSTILPNFDEKYIQWYSSQTKLPLMSPVIVYERFEHLNSQAKEIEATKNSD